jgi:ADP-ribose pyrophosphatase YjhB (NUDIX family)
MTNYEKKNIITKDFDSLWNNLWGGETLGSKYMNEKKISREKMQILQTGLIINDKIVTLEDIILNSKTTWTDPEWGFPKGRRNYQERDYATGLREFVEETGIPKTKINLIQNVCQYEETFTGSNFKSYTHKYFLAVIDDNTLQNFQRSEVGQIGWYNYNEAIKQIRPYNLEKIDILHKINKVLQEYRLIF